jgi:hypothetical protein
VGRNRAFGRACLSAGSGAAGPSIGTHAPAFHSLLARTFRPPACEEPQAPIDHRHRPSRHALAVDSVSPSRPSRSRNAPPPKGSAPRWPPSGRPRGCDRGRQDREPAPVGLRSVLVGGSSGGIFPRRAGRDEGAEGGAGAGGELTGSVSLAYITTRRGTTSRAHGLAYRTTH